MGLKDRLDRARQDPVEWLKRHDDFHEAISAVGGRKRLQQELVRVHLAVRPYLLVYMKLYNTVEMPGLEHTVLLDSLSSGATSGAEEAMRAHVANAGRGLVKFLHERDAEVQESKGIARTMTRVSLTSAQSEVASGG